METGHRGAVAFPARRDAPARVPPGARGIFQPGTARLGSIGGQPGFRPPRGRCRERIQAAAEKKRECSPCIQKYLYCSLPCPWPSPACGPAASRHPGDGSGMAEQRLLLAGSCAAPCPVLLGAEPGGCPPADGLPRPCCPPPAPSGLQVVREPQQLLLAVDGFEVLQVRPGGDGAPYAQGLLRACRGELRSGLGSPIPLHPLRLHLPTPSITAGSPHGSPFAASRLTP